MQFVVECSHVFWYSDEADEIVILSDVLTEQEAFGVEALEKCTREIFDHGKDFYEAREFGDASFYEASESGMNVTSEVFGMYSEAGG